MKKRVIIVFLVCIFISQIVSAGVFYTDVFFSDGFESYLLGQNTIQPNWVPQYGKRANVSFDDGDKALLIDSYSEYGGDRDIHVLLNRSELYPEKWKTTDFEFNYKVVDCNSTWKSTQKVTPQGASAYLYYFDPNNFIDVEFKINANDTFCGSGLAQISAFKRVDGISTAIIPYTTFNFTMDKTYKVNLVLDKLNSTNYNLNVNLDERLVSSSAKIGSTDIKGGRLLLENAGTKTYFDDVFVKVVRITKSRFK